MALLESIGTVVAVGGFLGGLIVGGRRFLDWAVSTDEERPVVPAHYSSLLQADHRQYPGYCPECGTRNEAGYTVCRNCSAAVPTPDGDRSDRDIETIVGR